MSEETRVNRWVAERGRNGRPISLRTSDGLFYVDVLPTRAALDFEQAETSIDSVALLNPLEGPRDVAIDYLLRCIEDAATLAEARRLATDAAATNHYFDQETTDGEAGS